MKGSQLTIFKIHPSAPLSLKVLSAGRARRPRSMLMAGGIAYETPSATTEAEVMALNVLDEPKKTQPNMTTQPAVHKSALSGKSSVG